MCGINGILHFNNGQVDTLRQPLHSQFTPPIHQPQQLAWDSTVVGSNY